MTDKSWQEIEKLYHSLLERKPAERAGFLQKPCTGDEALLKEVESLLAHEGEAEKFIESPALGESSMPVPAKETEKRFTVATISDRHEPSIKRSPAKVGRVGLLLGEAPRDNSEDVYPYHSRND